PYGYAGVQVSPVTEVAVLANRPWWERYQPVTYEINGRSGNEKQFADMVSRCNKVGVRIYVDVVLNHMTMAETGKGTAGHTYDGKNFKYEVPYSELDFHQHPDCPSPDLNIRDDKYDDPIEARNCQLGGLRDLDQGKDWVQQKQSEFLNKLIDIGVAGFRSDASKHQWPANLQSIISKLHTLNTTYFPANSRPLFYHEYISGTNIKASEYTPLGRVIEFKNYDNLARRPVILWHGITQDSDVWLISAEGVLNGKGVYMENNLVVNDCHQSVTQNLAFTLSACGYDVWLPNFRGTTYSMGHLILDPVFNQTYWQYTFTELGLYDVPAVVQYVLRVTDKSSVAYIGHSLGSTAMFIQLSLIPEFERLVKPFIALAPFVFMSHMTSTLRYALPFEPTLSSYTIPIGIPVTIAQFIGVWMCGNQYFRQLCADMFFYSASGYDPDNLNTTRIPIYVSHTGAPYSSWVYAHVGQLIRDRGFRLFDYGVEGNWERLYTDINVTPGNECWERNYTEFEVEYCRRDAIFYWDVYLDVEATDDTRKAYCCALYDYFDCVKKAAKSQCKDNETAYRDEITDQVNKIEDDIGDLVCEGTYTHGSMKCEFPVWASVLCLLGFLLGMGILAYLMFGVCRLQSRFGERQLKDKTIGLAIAVCCTASPYSDPHFVEDRQVIVHLMEWKYSEIAKECELFLGPYGYAGVQVSPVTEVAVLANRPWWERYQPVSPVTEVAVLANRPWWERYQPVTYEINGRSGNEQQFADMVSRCNKVGVRIYVDVVLNHMTMAEAGKGTAGHAYNGKNFTYEVPYSSLDFHQHPDCPSPDLNIRDDKYDDPIEARNCQLGGLRDLDQGKDWVQQKQSEFLNKLIDIGVAGFRSDASKHQWPANLQSIISKLHTLNTTYFPANSRPLFYHEYISGTNIKASEYTPLGRVIEFKNYDNLARVQLIQSRGFAAETHAVITSDGYILNVFRIRNPYNPSSHERPVILWHGITQDSDVWLISAEG
ncbi:unnamed protein product, partial [Oppiella nova]